MNGSQHYTKNGTEKLCESDNSNRLQRSIKCQAGDNNGPTEPIIQGNFYLEHAALSYIGLSEFGVMIVQRSDKMMLSGCDRYHEGLAPPICVIVTMKFQSNSSVWLLVPPLTGYREHWIRASRIGKAQKDGMMIILRSCTSIRLFCGDQIVIMKFSPTHMYGSKSQCSLVNENI